MYDARKTIVVTGGNSGIGLQAAKEFIEKGHRVIILGRDTNKGKAALESPGIVVANSDEDDKPVFLSVDLSTHEGVRAAAEEINKITDVVDAILHTVGVFFQEDVRTVDGLHPFFAVNYLSRYHLTQLLLPALRRSQRGHVIMMTAAIPPETPVDFKLFPKFDWKMKNQIQVANHHYAVYLAKQESRILAGVANAGAAKTNILRSMPWYVRFMASLLSPLMFNSLEQSAHNVVEACLRDDWPNATYWSNPGAFEKQIDIGNAIDERVTQQIMEISRNLTGV